MKALLIIAVLLALGAGGGFYWYSEREKEKAAQAQYDATLARLERLFADAYDPPDRPLDALTLFRELGCKGEWVASPATALARRSEAERVVAADPELLARLRSDVGPVASYVLAHVVRKTGFAGKPAVVDLDPEVLLRRAAGKGHGHAQFYFANLAADRDPLTDDPLVGATAFFDLNKQLEQAADAGSGSAAHLLGFRTSPELFKRYAEMQAGTPETPAFKEMFRRAADVPVPRTSRSPREWWCRAAELGHAGGQVQCYLHGKRRWSEGMRLLVTAADAGNEQASFALAELSARGKRGFAKDEAKAKEYYCHAIFNGHPRAAAGLARMLRAQELEAKRQLAEEKRLSKLKPRARQAEIARREKARKLAERRRLAREAQLEAWTQRPPGKVKPKAVVEAPKVEKPKEDEEEAAEEVVVVEENVGAKAR